MCEPKEWKRKSVPTQAARHHFTVKGEQAVPVISAICGIKEHRQPVLTSNVDNVRAGSHIIAVLIWVVLRNKSRGKAFKVLCKKTAVVTYGIV